MCTIIPTRALALLASAAALASCATWDDGYYGGGYADGYGYPPECHDDWGDIYKDCYDAGYIARRGYGYGSIWFGSSGYPYGWYDGFYYPGYSVFIYDRAGRRHRWADRHRRYWYAHRDRRRGEWRGRRHDGDYRRGDRRRGDWRGGRHDGEYGRDDRRRGDWRGRRYDGDARDRDQRRRGDRRRDVRRDERPRVRQAPERTAPAARRQGTPRTRPAMQENAPQTRQVASPRRPSVQPTRQRPRSRNSRSEAPNRQPD